MNLISLFTLISTILHLTSAAITCDPNKCPLNCCDNNNNCASTQAYCVNSCENNCKSGCCISGTCQETSDSCSEDSSVLYFGAAIGVGMFIICIACAYRQRKLQEQRRRAANYTNQNQPPQSGPNQPANRDNTLIIPPNANIVQGFPITQNKPHQLEISHISEIPYGDVTNKSIREEDIQVEEKNKTAKVSSSQDDAIDELHNILKRNGFSPPEKITNPFYEDDIELETNKIKLGSSPVSGGQPKDVNSASNKIASPKSNSNRTDRLQHQSSARDPTHFIPAPKLDDDEDENLFS